MNRSSDILMHMARRREGIASLRQVAYAENNGARIAMACGFASMQSPRRMGTKRHVILDHLFPQLPFAVPALRPDAAVPRLVYHVAQVFRMRVAV